MTKKVKDQDLNNQTQNNTITLNKPFIVFLLVKGKSIGVVWFLDHVLICCLVDGGLIVCGIIIILFLCRVLQVFPFLLQRVNLTTIHKINFFFSSSINLSSSR